MIDFSGRHRWRRSQLFKLCAIVPRRIIRLLISSLRHSPKSFAEVGSLAKFAIRLFIEFRFAQFLCDAQQLGNDLRLATRRSKARTKPSEQATKAGAKAGYRTPFAHDLAASRRVATGMSIASPGLLVNEDCSPPDSPGTSSKPSRSGSLAQSSRRRITRLARTCFRSGPVRTGTTDDAGTQDTDAQPFSMPAWRKVCRERLNPFHRRAAVVARSVCRNSRCQTKELQCPI